jgi:hypothetical protein
MAIPIEPRDRRVTRPEDAGQIAVGQAKPPRGRQGRTAKHRRRLGRRARPRRDDGHQLKQYAIFISIAKQAAGRFFRTGDERPGAGVRRAVH